MSDDEGAWAGECVSLLTGVSFPAGQDELIATLIRRHAPVRLLRHLADLDRDRRYANPWEVVMACGGKDGPSPLSEGADGAVLSGRSRP